MLFICRATVGLCNKLHTMDSTYIKVFTINIYSRLQVDFIQIQFNQDTNKTFIGGQLRYRKFTVFSPLLESETQSY